METNHKTFKPFDKVLVKATFENDFDYEGWSYDLYSHWDSNTNSHICIGSAKISDNNILPYEGNEHFVGTTDEPEEEVKLEEGEWILCTNIHTAFNKGSGLRKFRKIKNGLIFVQDIICVDDDTPFKYAIPFKDFNPSDMEETKKHILCVKNGKVVRYKPE